MSRGLGDVYKRQVITGVFSLAAGIIGTFSIMNMNNNQNAVTVNVNGEKMSVSLDEYEKMYNELKKDYDTLFSENQKLLKEKNIPPSNLSSANEPENENGAYIGEQITAYYSTMYYKEYSSLDTDSFYGKTKIYPWLCNRRNRRIWNSIL